VRKTQTFKIGIAVMLAVIALIPVVYMTCVFIGIHRQSTPITDICKYTDVLGRWKKQSPETVAHFPDRIPAEATNAVFFSRPCFLQGDGRIELRFTTSAEAICRYYEESLRLATETYYDDSDGFIQVNQSSDSFEVICFHPDPSNTPEHKPRYGVGINRGFERDNILAQTAILLKKINAR
jgi:hypothetical protein